MIRMCSNVYNGVRNFEVWKFTQRTRISCEWRIIFSLKQKVHLRKTTLKAVNNFSKISIFMFDRVLNTPLVDINGATYSRKPSSTEFLIYLTQPEFFIPFRKNQLPKSVWKNLSHLSFWLSQIFYTFLKK